MRMERKYENTKLRCSLHLLFGDRPNTGTNIFGDKSRRVNGESNDGRGKFNVHRIEPVVYRRGKYLVRSEIPEEYLDKKRGIAEKFQITVGKPADGPDVTHAHNRYNKAQQKGEHDGNQGKFEGRFNTCQ